MSLINMAHALVLVFVTMTALTTVAVLPYLTFVVRFDRMKLRQLTINSFSMRFAHSFHNLAFSAITNSVLSFAAPGAVSTFQYARKVADGLSTVAVGPNATIYHARQAVAWSGVDRRGFGINIRDYLSTMLPLMVISATVLFAAIELLPKLLTDDTSLVSIVKGVKLTFLALAVWNLIVAVETIAVGVLLMELNAKLLLLCNVIFVIVFFLLTRALNFLSPSACLVISLLTAQTISVVNFSYFAWRAYLRKFKP